MQKLFFIIKKILWYIVHPQKIGKRFESTSLFPIIRPLFLISTSLRSDFIHNTKIHKDKSHILIARHLLTKPVVRYNNHFLQWVKAHHPDIFKRIKLCQIPGLPLDLRNTALFVPWFHDPLKERFPNLYNKVYRIQQKCEARQIPVVNRIQNLSNSIKHKALGIMGQLGIRTAVVVKVDDPQSFEPKQYGLTYPFILRENLKHGGTIKLIENRGDLKNAPWNKLINPIALEYIDTQNDDGCFRKYRYVLMGSTGAPRHLLITKNWCAHAEDRILSAACQKEEIDYLNCARDPNHEILNQAREALGFDVVAFDYSYDKEGKLVVWEPNPYPLFWFRFNEENDCEYQRPAVHHIYKSLLMYYLKRTQIKI